MTAKNGSCVRWRGRLRLALISMLPLVTSSCAEGVTLVRETPTGGVVAYLFKEERGGPVLSSFRGEAIQVIQKKCPAGYTIVKEGEIRGPYSVSGIEGAEDEIRNRRWGLQFQCQTP